MVKETGKFIINDLEMPSVLVGKRKRTAGGAAPTKASKEDRGSDESSVGDNVSETSSDSEEDQGDLKKRMKLATKRQKISGT